MKVSSRNIMCFPRLTSQDDQVMGENILSIVSLLTVFSECDMSLSKTTVARMLERVDTEWPSAKMLMEVRGQKTLEERIEDLIGQLRRCVKE